VLCRVRLGATLSTRDSNQLRGRHAEIVVSDPWDLVNAGGGTRFSCVIVEVEAPSEEREGERVLVRLNDPVAWREQVVEYFVVRNRYGQKLVGPLIDDGMVHCNAIVVPIDLIDEGSPWGVERGRGNLGAIVDLVLRE
jgi:hypothetical protein